MSLYEQRGVSSQKKEVHHATRNLHKGLFPKAFCNIYPDYMAGTPEWVNVMHSDGAGTKSIVAYLYWKETGDLSVWKGIAKDAIVMNLDDLICTGIHDNILFSSIIDRNKRLIPGEVLEAIIEGTREVFDELYDYGINIHYLGGETADVGDIVRTISVNASMTARWPTRLLITNETIQPNDVIVGLASFGQAIYEDTYNSGIGSNGLTSARHDLLQKNYGFLFPETLDYSIENGMNRFYCGSNKLSDTIVINGEPRTIASLLLSPTRTYAPLMKNILDDLLASIHGIVHCSGGGQTKCLKYLPNNCRAIKDNLFAPPPIFDLIQKSANIDLFDMYQVFNMGHRLEIYTTQDAAQDIIFKAKEFGISARVIGRVEENQYPEVVLDLPDGISYTFYS